MRAAKKNFMVTPEMEAIDRLGKLKQEIAKLTEEHNKLEKKLRRKLGARSGLLFRITVFDGVAKTFNFAKARRLLGAAVYEKCWTETEYRSSRLTKLSEP
jgi:hypothetical protein